MKYPKISIIIVNFNQKQTTLDCLESLSSIIYPNYEIILVDNNSKDDSVEVIGKKYPNIKMVQSTENLGFAGGNNIGFKEASGDYILLLNNDTKVTPKFLEPLVEDFTKIKNLGIVQSKMFVMDKPTLLDSVASFQTTTGFLYHKGYLDTDKPEYQKFLYSFSAKGACMMIDRKVLKLGLFDETYFAYFEETDLCWRAWLLGFKVGFEPRSVIFHKMGVTSSKMNKAFINYHSFKNRIRTILKNTSMATLCWMLPLHLSICVVLALYFLINRDIAASKSIFRALWWNLTNIDEILRLRKKVQSLRKISDQDIFRMTLKNPSLSFYLRHLSLVKGYLSNDR